MRKILVVIPCYNEAARLQPAAFVAFARDNPAVAFLFVNDGSADATGSLLDDVAAQAPEALFALHLEHNRGKAEAVRRGVLRAFELGAELIGYWDADLATPLEVILDFAKVLDRTEAMMVFGSRVRLLGRQVRRSAHRHYLGRVFASLVSLSLQLPIYDTQCGAKLFRANHLFRQAFAEPFELGWSFDVELFLRLRRLAAYDPRLNVRSQLIEFPLQAWIDAPGSKLRLRDFPRLGLELAKIARMSRGG